MNKIEIYDDFYLFSCPHCDMSILVYKNERNCGIFRCAFHKHKNQSINPHASKIECEELKSKNLIYGCGKPFMIDKKVQDSDDLYAMQCDYI